MKIDHILVKGFLGVSHVEVPTHAPVQFFCGFNRQGKSSTRDAVALALSADLGRIKLRKEIPALLHGDAKNAEIAVTTADGDVYSITLTASGKMADSQKGKAIDPAMPFVLDAQRFADLPATGRREFLLALMQIGMAPADIEARLVAAVNDTTRIAAIKPFLRHGFAESAKQARENATAAKARWRATTGETWGPEKAGTWAAEKPAVVDGALAAAEQALDAADATLAAAQQQAGAVDAQRQQFDTNMTTLTNLRGKAEQLVRRREKLQRDEADLADWQLKLNEAIARAGTAPRVGLVHDLARAVQYLADVYGGDLHEHAGVLQAYEVAHGPLEQDGVGDAEARARIPTLTSTRDLMASAVRNSMRDVRESEDAAAQVKQLEDQMSVPFDLAAADAAAGAVREATLARRACLEQRDTLRTAVVAMASADQRTADAATAHADVLAWDSIADKLGPEGIQLQLLRDALAPFNARLAQSAVDAEWDQVFITDDLEIQSAGRQYAMLSKSEKWRCNAMIAEAISFSSGLFFLLLDEFDMLDIQGRGDCFAWLGAAAECGELHSAFLFGTLLQGRPKPGTLPECVDDHWIENGVCVELALQGA